MTTDQVQAYVMLSAMDREDTYHVLKRIYPEMQDWEFENAWEQRPVPEFRQDVNAVFLCLFVLIVFIFILLCTTSARAALDSKHATEHQGLSR